MPTTLKGVSIKAGEDITHVLRRIRDAGGKINLPFEATGLVVTENADLVPERFKPAGVVSETAPVLEKQEETPEPEEPKKAKKKRRVK
jgi:hypothetical protein